MLKSLLTYSMFTVSLEEICTIITLQPYYSPYYQKCYNGWTLLPDKIEKDMIKYSVINQISPDTSKRIGIAAEDAICQFKRILKWK